ncbi:MAG: hypothetical protein RL308_1674 [Bacteroidota bacterium]|jgi:hypothetical protein
MASKNNMNEIAINISYNAHFSDYELEDFEGVQELKTELSKHYVSRIKGTPVGRGGGVYEFVVDIMMNISLGGFTKFILENVAFDLIKSGTKSLVLKPFMKAFEDFNSKNGGKVAIREFKFQFEDSEVVIRSVNNQGVYSVAPLVFEKLAKVYSNLLEPNSNKHPNRICIPVVYDRIMEKTETTRYRELLNDEEEYLFNKLSLNQYFEFWGLNFEFNHAQPDIVFDVQNNQLTSDEFFSGDIFARFVISTLDYDGEEI